MGKNFSFTAILSWLKSSGMFERPSKKIPGKWVLWEYYIEPENELINIKKEQMEAENFFWEIEFGKDQTFFHKTNLSFPLVKKIAGGNWSRTRNFITIIHPENFRNSVEFQFAINKETLKLLKKDKRGRIEFFGFFRKAGKNA